MRFFTTDSSTTLLWLRVVLGAVMLPHGLQKAFGWFGGYGFDGTMGFFASLGMPALLGLLVIAAETIGAIALLTGTATRLAAFGMAATMLGAMLLVHLPNGFFMNWGGTAAGEGVELHLLAIGLAIPLIARGGGAYSVDRGITAWFARRRSSVDVTRPVLA